ncbi:hypothetical protein BD289DRAFT_18922 [Coniella lustricola]|uniref:DUF7708 domain-containing protein n=1 Tax=Coniella lustricola TaxID=2025994 RepID=A0A2T3AJC7_9PEZI|nr:hypothetical protein BD289DRAFT_18922 [Coniella lustricola]
MARFAGAYSSILDAVTSAAGPYAQVGWQTISALLIVFVNKGKNDTNLQDHMNQIETMLPRLGMWKGIYQGGEIGTEIQRLVGEIYTKVIDFSRAVAEYCCHFWTRRVRHALVPSATLPFDQVAKSIYKILAEVNATAAVGLHARNLTILGHIDSLNKKADIAEMRAKRAEYAHAKLLEDNRMLRASRDRQAKQADERLFHSLKQRLNNPQSTMEHPGLSLSITKTSLQSAFPDVDEFDPADVYSTYEHMTPQTILSHYIFQAWLNRPGSALLYIHGDTRPDGRNPRGFAASWLSPAAIHISEYLNKQVVRTSATDCNPPMTPHDSSVAEEQVAFFSCRSDADHLQARASEVLAAIALKLVSMRKTMLRDRHEDFQAIISPVFPQLQQPIPPASISRHHSASSFGTPPPPSLMAVNPYGGPSWAAMSSSSPALQSPMYGDVAGYQHTPSSNLYLPLQQQQQPGLFVQPSLTQLRLLVQEILEELACGETPLPQPLLQGTMSSTTSSSPNPYSCDYKPSAPRSAVKYIILDRLDRAVEVQISDIMNELLQLVQINVAWQVKIAVVVEESQMEGSWPIQDLPEHLAPRDRLFDLHLNQRQLDDKIVKRSRIWSDDSVTGIGDLRQDCGAL